MGIGIKHRRVVKELDLRMGAILISKNTAFTEFRCRDPALDNASSTGHHGTSDSLDGAVCAETHRQCGKYIDCTRICNH